MRQGAGTTIALTEVPEMFGGRNTSHEPLRHSGLFERTVDLIEIISRTILQATTGAIYENPSPGNKKGGISTLEDKSLEVYPEVRKRPC